MSSLHCIVGGIHTVDVSVSLRCYLLVESKVLVAERVKPHNVACREPNDDIQMITAACKNVDVV